MDIYDVIVKIPDKFNGFGGDILIGKKFHMAVFCWGW
jgi:hypothetical protein